MLNLGGIGSRLRKIKTMKLDPIQQRNAAISWARKVLEQKDDYVIMDTETTGLKDSDVIIHFAVMDLDGNMLIDTRVKPMSKRRMSQDATYIHGLKMKDLQDAPLFEEVVNMFRPIAASKKLLSYNAAFHADMFDQSLYNEGVSGDQIVLDCWDVKTYYVKYSGMYNAALPGRKNTGVGDCRATLDLIRKMAESELAEVTVAPEKKMPMWMAIFLLGSILLVLLILILM